ncbi:MAG: hypothetical protein V3U03_06970 [Myxococcota bacterium]
MNISRVLAAGTASLFFALPAAAEMTHCTIHYSLSGWSAFYMRYDGSGRVTCENGQRASVALRVRGGGVTFGKSQIDRGTGTFSEVEDISEVFGSYVSVGGHAGATQSGEGWAMTKGQVSLVLSGTGRGFDLGFAFAGFTITRR